MLSVHNWLEIFLILRSHLAVYLKIGSVALATEQRTVRGLERIRIGNNLR